MSARVYLDHNATSPLRPQARAAMLDALETLGNPSSVHAEGRAAKALLEDARAAIAQAIGAERRSVVFTSGATEAANLALSPALRREGDEAPIDVLLIGAGEHHCVLQGHRFPLDAVETLPLTRGRRHFARRAGRGAGAALRPPRDARAAGRQQ